MAKVRVVRQVRIGRRTVDVKKVPNLAPLIVRSTIEATTVQLRVLSEEVREHVRDRIFNQDAQPPGRAVVARPPMARRKNIPAVTRDAARIALLSHRRVLTKARARRPRLDGRPLIASGDYAAKGIEIYRGDQPANGGIYYMVRPEQRQHNPGRHGRASSPITMLMLAKVHEFGSARHRIPARPVWGPSVRAIVAAFRRLRPTIRAEGLRRALRSVT